MKMVGIYYIGLPSPPKKYKTYQTMFQKHSKSATCFNYNGIYGIVFPVFTSLNIPDIVGLSTGSRNLKHMKIPPRLGRSSWLKIVSQPCFQKHIKIHKTTIAEIVVYLPGTRSQRHLAMPCSPMVNLKTAWIHGYPPKSVQLW